jgi:pimeloyl-ACP methyl ester carboxylesterase
MWWTLSLALASVDPQAAEIPEIRPVKRPAPPPLSYVHHPGEDEATLVVLLPGLFADARTLEQRGFVAALREAGLQADITAVNAHVSYYADRSISARLTEDVLHPARERYDQVWLIGISLGGLGGLLTARDAPELVDGVMLMSPWLGRRAAVEPVRDAGGLAAWDAFAGPDAPWESSLWAWMREEHHRGWPSAEVHLGFGHRDLVVVNHRTLAGALAADRVTPIPGGHAWRTWRALAEAMVGRLDSAHPLRDGAKEPEGAR